eukprot:SAG31_NODE_36422_length_313_cov_1.158879_1_plen_60_part_10
MIATSPNLLPSVDHLQSLARTIVSHSLVFSTQEAAEIEIDFLVSFHWSGQSHASTITRLW